MFAAGDKRKRKIIMKSSRKNSKQLKKILHYFAVVMSLKIIQTSSVEKDASFDVDDMKMPFSEAISQTEAL